MGQRMVEPQGPLLRQVEEPREDRNKEQQQGCTMLNHAALEVPEKIDAARPRHLSPFPPDFSVPRDSPPQCGRLADFGTFERFLAVS